MSKNSNSLHVNPIGTPFIQLTEVESSNNYAMAQVQAQLAEHGYTWFAHKQTAGKGQRGKSWNMEAGQNIIMTSIVEPHSLQIHQSFHLSAAVALACYDLFSAYALDETTIKWPNDLYWRDRKAGGILIENVLQGNEWKYAIVGIGININQTSFPPQIANAVSLKQITGKTYDCIELAHQLCDHIEKRWQQLTREGSDKVFGDYNDHLYKLNRQVKFRKGSQLFLAEVQSVNQSGSLVVKTGTEMLLTHGEYEWVVEQSK